MIHDRCAGDPAREREIRALLEADDAGDPGGFFAGVVGAEAAALTGPSMRGALLAEPGATTKPREPEGPRGARGPVPQR